MNRLYYWLLGLLCIVIFHIPGQAQSISRDDHHDLRVMTYNAYQGTDLVEVSQASSQQEFLVAVGQTITQVRATNPRERMHALAKQIIAAGPALVSLQELNEWDSGSFDPATSTCGSTTPEFQMLHELMNALRAAGGHYLVAVQASEYAFPPTPGLILPATFLCVGLVNHIAILARTDLDRSRFQWSNPRSAQYQSVYAPTTAIGTVPFPRGWVSVDVRFNGRAVRFIGTHLESADADIRRRQGEELRNGPAQTRLPVIIAMDSNAQAAPQPMDPTYTDFLRAGFLDAWSSVHPSLPGFTCCQNQLVNNRTSALYQRIDLILTRGNFDVHDVTLFGLTQASKTRDGLWPSDHAGVAAQLDLEDPFWLINPFAYRRQLDTLP